MKLLDGFTESQNVVLAGCVTEAKGQINQSQNDRMIFNIWLAALEPQDCRDYPETVQYSYLASRT
jgi:hypothetical protein